MKNLSAKEQKQLREKAKKELVRLESIDTDTIQLLDRFKTEPLPPKGGRFNQRLKPPKVG